MEGGNTNRLHYRMAETGPQLLRDVLEAQGWLPFIEGESEYWNLWWKGSRYRISDYENCMPWQRLNHFPKTAAVTRKDTLFRTLKTMKGIHGKLYDFFPQTFSLPNEYVKFVRVYADEEEKNEKSMWIFKPADLSRGRKIFVFRNLQDLTYDCNAILQRYVPNPLLISGYKFDMRCYVVVRSYSPLCIYLYGEGLARFATCPYDTSTLTNRFSHLTNTSINKYSPTLNSSKEDVGSGCKWNLKRLRSYFKNCGLPFEKIWDRMIGIMILTLLPLVGEVTNTPSGCFELYGFDIIIDDQLRPWLLEVNLSPALSVDSDVDVEVKKPLLQDVLNLIGLSQTDADAAKEHADWENRLKQETRSRKRAAMGMYLHQKTQLTYPVEQRPKSAPVEQPINYPQEVGDFTMVYPFNDTTKSLAFGKSNTTMKTVLLEVRKFYMP